jgi:hypothetical protein
VGPQAFQEIGRLFLWGYFGKNHQFAKTNGQDTGSIKFRTEEVGRSNRYEIDLAEGITRIRGKIERGV